MNKALQLILILLLPFFAFSKSFTVKGNIEGLSTGTVSLAYVNGTGDDTTITASVTNGAFTLTGKVPEPQLARLTITGGWSYNTSFYLEDAPITMHMVKDAPGKTSITGSVSNSLYEKLKPGLNIFFEQARQNETAHHQNAGNKRAIQNADSIWFAQQHQWIQSIRATISANADNYAALYFIRWLLFRPDNYDSILSVFMPLSPAVRQGADGKKLFADMQHLHATAPGQAAPEISGKDVSGQPVALAAFKGKVVLLDFWASYCGPCRQENHNMIPVYKKYHTEGFETVSFSLDNDRAVWVQALQTDGLPWPQVSELRGGASATAGTYEITDLPRNVLIDKTGKIYAKDLHGEELIEAIENLLAKGK